MANRFIANQALIEELQKQHRIISKAYSNILKGNYFLAKELLLKALSSMEIQILEEKEK